jgi:hypothetical protein
MGEPGSSRSAGPHRAFAEAYMFRRAVQPYAVCAVPWGELGVALVCFGRPGVRVHPPFAHEHRRRTRTNWPCRGPGTSAVTTPATTLGDTRRVSWKYRILGRRGRDIDGLGVADKPLPTSRKPVSVERSLPPMWRDQHPCSEHVHVTVRRGNPYEMRTQVTRITLLELSSSESPDRFNVWTEFLSAWEFE